MSKKYTHSEAFAYFGTKKANPRNSHCALSPDKKRLAVTCWEDRFEWSPGRVIYEDRVKQDNGPGARELSRNLAYARDHLNGEFHVVMAVADDRKSDTRRIKECYPRKFVMRLVHLDLETGRFTAVAEQPQHSPQITPRAA